MGTSRSYDSLIGAIAALDPQPRQRQWVSLSFCVLDGVYSIGASYDHHVVPVVGRVAADFEVNSPVTTPEAAASIADPVPLGALLTRYADSDALIVATNNRQNTSPRGGIRKADAVLRYARILHNHDVNTLADARAALAVDPLISRIDDALRVVPGEGSEGVRRGYLWMLVGDQHMVKPDRMVLRWLARNGFEVAPHAARELLDRAAVSLTEQIGRAVTPWEIDHAIWLAAQRRKPGIASQATPAR